VICLSSDMFLLHQHWQHQAQHSVSTQLGHKTKVTLTLTVAITLDLTPILHSSHCTYPNPDTNTINHSHDRNTNPWEQVHLGTS